MMAMDSLDEQKSIRLRQRLWGAAVFIALLVIFLPLLLDGSGSESQYRRVERLREEPPRVINAEGVREPVQVVPDSSTTEPQQALSQDHAVTEPVQNFAEAEDPIVIQQQPAQAAQSAPTTSTEPLRAWVVQAGSFGERANAIAVRDKLRRAGFPSFVTPTDSATPLYRVRVGPMINLQQAESNRDKVVRLLNREAIVVSYP